MEFKEFGNKNGKKLLMLPGTGCTWQLNFQNVIDNLAEKYYLICVNYDGFEGDKNKLFTDMLTVTSKIEDYILEKHNGKIDGAYGSSLGGSFVGLLIQRKNIHIEHGFIGSSDLDQGGKVFAKILATIFTPMFSGACKNEKKRNKLIQKLQKSGAMGEGEQSLEFAYSFINNMANLNPKTITKEFYSDYITPLEDGIDIEGTKIHIIYALKMGEKYRKRYIQHFKNPDIHEFDMKHEVWLYDDKWKRKVLDMIDECMEI